ncbi:3-dehydroquinate synthase [Termitidicoccus mucosus]|uniref:3-dehydroquinate synthase n=1 Tax=Termitidicoccus mucosus TaxID=1184151 RepID=A0A178IJW7_9BACT|nr:3-dehydroquinate synthase [Opitutaceae bacterium TSB47]
MFTIKSRSHDYTVENFDTLAAALASIDRARAYYLVDQAIITLYGAAFVDGTTSGRTVVIEATEENKAFECLTPVFLSLLERGLKRDGVLVVIGGGVLQDIGCFIATVLFRGLRWELVPTTLLAQADSCIGSKSSINIGPYKNQIGTFYPPHRVLLTPQVLKTLPPDEIRSGLGEIIKLQLLRGQADFDELMADLSILTSVTQAQITAKWVHRSLSVKQPYIEADEYDRDIRNLLNYGHTFGHAYESATHYGIPHGIAVTLGMLTATYLSVRLGLVSEAHYFELKAKLSAWHQPYGAVLREADRSIIFKAIKYDKKNTGDAVNCILTCGPGRMRKTKVDFIRDLQPAVTHFIEQELAI